MLLSMCESDILIEGFKRNTDIDTLQCYFITWPEWMECPEIISCSPIEIYVLLLGAYQYIFLHGGATLIVPELFPTVGCFGRRRKHFDNHTRSINDVALPFKVMRIATH